MAVGAERPLPFAGIRPAPHTGADPGAPTPVPGALLAASAVLALALAAPAVMVAE